MILLNKNNKMDNNDSHSQSKQSLTSIEFKTNRKIMNELIKIISSMKGNTPDDQKKFVCDYLKDKSKDITQIFDEEKNTCIYTKYIIKKYSCSYSYHR